MMKRIPVAAFVLGFLLSTCAIAGPDRLLVVLSEATSITLKNGKQHPTGYFLSELMVPAEEVARLGCEIVVATPTGKAPTVDRTSDAPSYFKDEAEYKKLFAIHSSMATIKAPLSLQALDEKQLSSFDGVFFPGGHAPMSDLVNNTHVARVLCHFHERALPTALICHGPVALLASRVKGAPWIYGGYRMTGFSTAEEKVAEAGALGGEVPFYLEAALKEAGGQVSIGPLWKSKAVRDRELITGQNPASDRELALHLLIALAEARLRKATQVVGYAPGLTKFEPGRLYEVTPFPKDWRTGVTNVYIGARLPSVDRDTFQKKLGAHLEHAKKVFGPVGMRGYLVLSAGDGEIALMNWASQETLDGASKAPGSQACAEEAAQILDPLVFTNHPDPTRLEHPTLKRD